MIGAATVWGTCFVVVQQTLSRIPVFHLLTLRFLLGALLLLPWLRRSGEWRTPGLLRDGLLTGAVLFASFVLQTLGLLWTTPSRSAFLTGLGVIMVPALGVATGTHRLRAGPVAGALCAALGLYLLYRPAAGGPPFGLGDLLTLGCALGFAGYIALLERAVPRHRLAALAVTQFGCVALLSAPSFLLSPPRLAEVTGTALAELLFVGALGTSLAFVAQLYAQRRLSAVQTAIILAFEPVAAAVTSVAARIEPWTSSLGVGGALVLSAMLLAELGGAPPPADSPARRPESDAVPSPASAASAAPAASLAASASPAPAAPPAIPAPGVPSARAQP